MTMPDWYYGGKKKKSSSRKNKKGSRKSNTPVISQLRYTFTGAAAGAASQHFIDTAAGLSLLNRKLFEQGKMYHIKKVRVACTLPAPNSATGALVQIGTASPNWVTTQAWKKAKRLHTQMISGRGGAPGAQLPAGVTAATWADFKVYLSPDHVSSGVLNVPEDSEAGTVSTNNSEWVYSEFTAPDETVAPGSDQYTSHLIGATSGAPGSFTSVGIIDGYQESRRTVEQDDTDAPIVTTSWMVNLFDDGDTLGDIAGTLRDEGDLPPYDLDDYPGGDTNLDAPMTRALTTTTATVPLSAYLPPATLGGFDAPCGLLELRVTSDQASLVYQVIVDVALGDYKGIKALPM